VARKVLVTMGGSDPDNVTLKVIQALQQVDMDGLEAIVVVGGSNPNHEELQAAVQDSRFPIRLESNVTHMPELMAWADVAVSAGGSTCWEIAFMGLPSLVLVLSENQQGIATGLDEAGVVLNVGWYTKASIAQVTKTLVVLLEDRGLRRRMGLQGRELVDGLGSERAVKFLQTLSYSTLESN
jgi:spore coat polysaccharide biosynthesis predicted glycosyltransferase SpsG